MEAARGSSRPTAPGSPPLPTTRETGQQQQEEQQQERQQPQNKGKQYCCSAGSSPQTVTPSCSMHVSTVHSSRAATALRAPANGVAEGGRLAAAEKSPRVAAAARGGRSRTSAAAEWPTQAASLRYALLESAVPVKICLAETEVAALQPPPPLLLLLLRNSYFPHVFATCYEHFQQALRPAIGEENRCPPSFTYRGKLLDWRSPVGVSFDCFAAGAPTAVAAAGRRARSAAAAALRRVRTASLLSQGGAAAAAFQRGTHAGSGAGFSGAGFSDASSRRSHASARVMLAADGARAAEDLLPAETSIDVSEISIEEEEEQVEEEQIVVADAEAAGCGVNLPWELTIHFRTPAAVLAATSNARAATAAAAAIPAVAGRVDPCCCGCAALRQQHQVSDVAAASAATGTAATSTAGATAPATTAALPRGEVTAAPDKRPHTLGTEENKEARRMREEAVDVRRSSGGGGLIQGSGEQPPIVAAAVESANGEQAAVAVTSIEQQSSVAGGAAQCGVKAAAAASTAPGGPSSAAAGEKPLPLPVPPPAYQGWASFESFLTNAIRQASFLLTGSAAAFQSLARAEEAALLRALRCLDVQGFLYAAAPLLTPLLLPSLGRVVEAADGQQRKHTHGLQQQQHRQRGQRNSSSTYDAGQMTRSVGVSGRFGGTCTTEDSAAILPGYGDVKPLLPAAESLPAASSAPGGRLLGGCPSNELSPVIEEMRTGCAVVPDTAAGTPRGAAARPGGGVAVAGKSTAAEQVPGTQPAARRDRAVTAAEDATAEEGRAAIAANAARRSPGRMLRRLPVRVYLVNHCCSSAASAVVGFEQQQESVSSKRLGCVSYAAAGRTMGGGLCNSRQLYDMADDQIRVTDAGKGCCCVSSVLLACPLFVPATAASCGSATNSHYGSSMTTTSRACSTGSVCHSSPSTRMTANNDITEGHKIGNTYVYPRPFAAGMERPSMSGMRSPPAGQSPMYTLGDMLHDLLPQLFPVKTWKLERNRGSCCCSVSSKSRVTCCRQQCHRQSASECASREEVNSKNSSRCGIADTRQQDATRNRGDADHSCCGEAALHSIGRQEAIVNCTVDREGGCGAGHVGFTEHTAEADAKRADTDDEEASEGDAQVGLDDQVAYIRSRFEHRSNRRDSCRVLVQGVEPLFDTPVYWLWLNAASFDFFLHVVVVLPPYV